MRIRCMWMLFVLCLCTEFGCEPINSRVAGRLDRTRPSVITATGFGNSPRSSARSIELSHSEARKFAEHLASSPSIGGLSGGWMSGYAIRFNVVGGETIEVHMDSKLRLWNSGTSDGDRQVPAALGELVRQVFAAER